MQKIAKHSNATYESILTSCLIFFSGLRVDYFLKRDALDLLNVFFFEKTVDNK